MAADIPQFTLNNGTKIPSVGMGCWMGTPGGGERVYEMVKNAIKTGYRHFDTASGYANEKEVGRAIRESGVPRSEIYLTTKLPNTANHKVREAFETSLADLDCEYVDLYLVHWPQANVDGVFLQPEQSPTVIETWKEMEKLLDTGKVKSIGVSNFSVAILDQLLPHVKVVPANNQVEMHPCLPYEDLKTYCDAKGILLTAYSPLGRPRPGVGSPIFITDDAVLKIAERTKSTPVQVALSWGVQRGTAVVPKSENLERMKANITLVKLTPEEMATIDALHKQPGWHKSLLAYHGADPGKVFGWTYKQLGWNMVDGGVVPQ